MVEGSEQSGRGGDGEWRSREKDGNGVEGGVGGGAEGTRSEQDEWNPGFTGAESKVLTYWR